ncbi:MAG TPA: hypothetical protein VKN14_02130, partial [Flavobacteriaceae bacterium]|nr:hypothetical protein [Flavobacteriaceae bacterium]
MVKNLLFLFISILTIPINGQNIQVDQSNSYNLFGEVLKKSKDIKYGEIVEQYNDYISKHPDNIAVKVYRCRFIGSAYYDEYDDYDTNYEETEKCIEELYSQYPENPEVLLYKLEYAYGEEKKELLNETISLYYSDKDKWSYNQVASLFEIGAYYYVEENDYKAIDYAERAEKFSDSLDLSILITNAQLREGNRDKALESILFSLYRDGEAWQLQEKGELLIELDQHDKAFELFERAKLKDSLYTSNTGLYKIFVENRKYEIA